METDRGAVLAVRAASRGVIDFREARLHDTKWWKRCRILLRQVSQDDDQELREAFHRHHLALVGNSGLTEESFESSQKEASSAVRRIAGGLKPWHDFSEAAALHDKTDKIREDYKAAFGYYPDDPEWLESTRKNLEEARARRAEQAANPVEDDHARVRRLRAEQQKRLEKLAAEQKRRY